MTQATDEALPGRNSAFAAEARYARAAGHAAEDGGATGTLDDPRLIEALEAYRAELDAGCKPDRSAFLARYPDVADALGGCLAALEFVHVVAPDLSDPGHEKGTDESGSRSVIRAQVPLGDYRIIREIGRGGMGVVYEAEQMSLGRRVALKVLPFAAVLDPKQLQRFKNEAHAAGQLHHTNIVPVISVGCERGVHYYAMQYIDGQTLAEVIRDLRRLSGLENAEQQGGKGEGERRRQGDGETPSRAAKGASQLANELVSGHFAPPKRTGGIDQPSIAYAAPLQPTHHSPLTTHSPTPPVAGISTERSTRSPAFFRTAASLGVQAAEALEYAHSLGIVHRDIKPANLLVDARRNLWITDFGLAHVQTDASLTLTGDLVGTLRYMSPEQTLANRVVVDHRTDIYSLGASLYELLTLEPAFPSDDRHELLRQIAADDPRPLRQLDRAVPRELETIVLKAMAKSPADRYSTAQELADDLERFLDDKPIRAKRPTLAQRLARWKRRHKLLVSGMTAAVALAVTGLAISTALIARERAEARRQRDLALQQRAEAERQRGQAEAHFNLAGQAIEDYFTLVSENVLLDVPGLQPLRKDLLEAALRYREAFLEQRGDDPKLQAELAAAHFRVAEIYMALGSTDAGFAALERAFEAVHHLRHDGRFTPEILNRLAGVYKGGRDLHRSSRHPSDPLHVQQTLQTGVEIWATLVQENPDVAGLQSDLAAFHSCVGELEASRGQRADAIRSFQKARDVAEKLVRKHPTVAVYRAELAGIYGRLGKVLQYVQQRHEATMAYATALELSKELVRDSPNVPGYREALARCYGDLGRSLSRSDPQNAEPELHHSLVMLRELVAEFPGVPAFRENLAITYFDLANMLWETDRLEDAEADYLEAVAILDKLATDFSTLPDYRRRLASYHYNLGLRLGYAGRADDAKPAYLQALALREKLIAEYPAVAQYHAELAWQLATCPDTQLRDPRRAVEYAQRVIELAPQYGTGWRTLGVAYYRAGNWDPALAALERSLQSSSSVDRLWFLAMTHWQLGHKEEARRWYDRAVQWMDENRPELAEIWHFRTEAAELLGEKDQCQRDEK